MSFFLIYPYSFSDFPFHFTAHLYTPSNFVITAFAYFPQNYSMCVTDVHYVLIV